MKIEAGLEDRVMSLIELQEGSLSSALGFEWLELSRERVSLRLVVLPKVKQPFGLLHGGVSVAIAESLASVGGWLNVDGTKYDVVGIEINANHLKSVREGYVTGTATPLHRGKSTQVWESRLTDEKNRLISISRCTLQNVAKVSS